MRMRGALHRKMDSLLEAAKTYTEVLVGLIKLQHGKQKTLKEQLIGLSISKG